MADNVEYERQQISSRVEDLERSVARIAELLETSSDGLFELNLRVGAGVEAWTGGRTAAVTSEITPGTGTVKWYDAQKGVGMIVRDGDRRDVFFTHLVIPAGGHPPQPGQRIGFTWIDSEKGPMAMSLGSPS